MRDARDEYLALSKEQRAAVLEVIIPIDDDVLHARYDDMLDECCDEVKIGNLSYLPSDVLRCTDPVAYRCGFSDWLDDETLAELDGEYYDVGDVLRAIDALETEDAPCERHLPEG